MKYFVKYKEYSNGRNKPVDKTRFFNTDDIEDEWTKFKQMTVSPVSLTDILPLPK